MRANLKIFSFFVLAITHCAVAQDAFFNQYFSAKLFLNPAMASSENVVTVNTNFRSQWKSSIIPYKTSQVSLIMPTTKRKGLSEKQGGGVGISVYNDNAGEGNFKTTGLYGAYSFDFPLSYDGKSTILSFGLQAGVVQKRVDLSNFQWGSQYVPFIGYDATIQVSDQDFVSQDFTNPIYPDFNAGFVISYNGEKNSYRKSVNYHFGAAVYHLNTPNESFVSNLESNLPRQIKVHGGLEWKVKEKYRLSPTALFITQGGVQHINAGMYVSYQVIPYGANPLTSETEFLLGTWYRLSDSFIFMTGLHNKNLTFGFSYDLNGGNLRSAGQGLGAYEISLTISQYKKERLKKISTPRI
ncbi:MAG: PorP/SprF family type IX secretion system membrane protein [Cyclobacteriaceae bacterium]